MSIEPQGTAANAVVEDGREGGNDDEDDKVEEFVDLRTFHPKPNVTWKCGRLSFTYQSARG